MTTIQPPAPVQKAIRTKISDRVARRQDCGEAMETQRIQQPGSGTDTRVEHEQPHQHTRHAGQRSRHVEEEAEDRRHPGPHPAAQDHGHQDSQHDQNNQPQHQIEQDVREGGHESEVTGHFDELVEASELTLVWRPAAFVDTSIMPLEVFLCQLCIRTRLV
jgi:hypothetical protein